MHFRFGVDTEFAALLELGRAGPNVVTLLGPFRRSREGYSYRDVDP